MSHYNMGHSLKPWKLVSGPAAVVESCAPCFKTRTTGGLGNARWPDSGHWHWSTVRLARVVRDVTSAPSLTCVTGGRAWEHSTGGQQTDLGAYRRDLATPHSRDMGEGSRDKAARARRHESRCGSCRRTRWRTRRRR